MALPACGDRPATQARQAGAQAPDEALPKPGQPDGSITGMSSRPGPGEVPLTGEPPPPVVAEPADQVDLLNPETGLLPGAAASPDLAAAGLPPEPTPQDAIAVIGDYYAAMDALCLPSSEEGFALVILEAMLCGRPVIATSLLPWRLSTGSNSRISSLSPE